MRGEDFWQAFGPLGAGGSAPYREAYPVALENGQELLLPIRAVPGGDTGLASLIINQASFAVQRELVEGLAEQLRLFAPEVVVGLPTLGLTVAGAVADMLGHSRYVPLGTSRKFWYADEMSVPLSSITTPDVKRLYLDPRLLPLLAGRRVALVDDVLSTGRSIAAGLELMRLAGVRPVAIGALMLQTERWRTALGEEAPPVVGVFATPLLKRQADGWIEA